MKWQPHKKNTDNLDERRLAGELREALLSGADSPPDSLSPDAVVRLLEAVPPAKKASRLLIWGPVLAACAACLLLFLPLRSWMGGWDGDGAPSLDRNENLSGGLLNNECTDLSGEIGTTSPKEQEEKNNDCSSSGNLLEHSYGDSCCSLGGTSELVPETATTTSKVFIYTIAASEVDDALGYGALLLDVREPVEYTKGHIPGALNLPLNDLVEIRTLSPDKERSIIVYCRTGVRSRQAAETLKALGYTHISDLGGIETDWPYTTVTGDEPG